LAFAEVERGERGRVLVLIVDAQVRVDWGGFVLSQAIEQVGFGDVPTSERLAPTHVRDLLGRARDDSCRSSGHQPGQLVADESRSRA